jgi:hypothetical protein
MGCGGNMGVGGGEGTVGSTGRPLINFLINAISFLKNII